MENDLLNGATSGAFYGVQAMNESNHSGDHHDDEHHDHPHDQHGHGDHLDQPFLAALFVIIPMLLILPAAVWFVMHRNSTIVQKRLPNIVLLQVSLFSSAMLLQLLYFNPFATAWHPSVPCFLYDLGFIALYTAGALLTITRQCVLYAMARASFGGQWRTTRWHKVYDRAFDIVSLVFASSEYKQYNRRKLGRKMSESTMTLGSGSSKTSGKRLFFVTAVAVVLGIGFYFLDTLTELNHKFSWTATAEEAHCGEHGNAILTPIGGTMIAVSCLMALRLAAINDMLKVGIEMAAVAFIPKIFYICLWALSSHDHGSHGDHGGHDDHGESESLSTNTIFGLLAILLEVLIPLYFPMLVAMRMKQYQKKVKNACSTDGFHSAWADLTVRQEICRVAAMQFSDENTEFLLALGKDQSDPNNLFRQFINANSPYELNLSSELRDSLTTKYKNRLLVKRDFKKVEDSVIQMIRENTMPMVIVALEEQ